MRDAIVAPATIATVAGTFAADPCSYFSQKDTAAQVDAGAPACGEASGGQPSFCSYRSASAYPRQHAFAWIGRLFFAHNRPAPFRHPLLGFLGDWRMWRQMPAGRVPL